MKRPIISSGTPNPSTHGAAGFPLTQWGMVLKAAQPQSPQGHEALSKLCATYWYPLYAFIRRRGSTPHEAEDLTQSFFARLVDKQFLEGISDEGGRFRSFLLTALKHFLANEWQKSQAQKRGGHQTIISLDLQTAEGHYQFEPVDQAASESIFERRWALALLDQVMSRLQADYASKGKAELFDRLRGCLSGDQRQIPYAVLAADLALSEGAIKVAVHRLRQRYGEFLRAEIATTVSDPADVPGEIRYLIAVLSR